MRGSDTAVRAACGNLLPSLAHQDIERIAERLAAIFEWVEAVETERDACCTDVWIRPRRESSIRVNGHDWPRPDRRLDPAREPQPPAAVALLARSPARSRAISLGSCPVNCGASPPPRHNESTPATSSRPCYTKLSGAPRSPRSATTSTPNIKNMSAPPTLLLPQLTPNEYPAALGLDLPSQRRNRASDAARAGGLRYAPLDRGRGS